MLLGFMNKQWLIDFDINSDEKDREITKKKKVSKTVEDEFPRPHLMSLGDLLHRNFDVILLFIE